MRSDDVPWALQTVARGQGGLAGWWQCDEHGVHTDARRRLVHAGAWTSPTRGVFALTPAQPEQHDAMRLRTAWLGLLAYGRDAVAVGTSALALHGVQGLPTATTPEISMPGRRFGRRRDGVQVRYFGDFPTTTVGGRLVATPAAALAQALPELRRRDALAVADSALHRGLIGADDLGSVRDAMRGRRGAASIDTWWHLVDGRAESPLESFARLECVDLGIPPHELQVVVRTPGGAFVGRCDLGWRLRDGRWLIAEVDGREWHSSAAAQAKDQVRQDALLRSGAVAWLGRFTAHDLSDLPGAVQDARRRHESA